MLKRTQRRIIRETREALGIQPGVVSDDRILVIAGKTRRAYGLGASATEAKVKKTRENAIALELRRSYGLRPGASDAEVRAEQDRVIQREREGR